MRSYWGEARKSLGFLFVSLRSPGGHTACAARSRCWSAHLAFEWGWRWCGPHCISDPCGNAQYYENFHDDWDTYEPRSPFNASESSKVEHDYHNRDYKN